ncbi:MAG: hypothetical protein JJU36_04900 [Phycisphaeraceae bacterium]|nr:hypothetical protein [Phycisphaeraceae bacterium]
MSIKHPHLKQFIQTRLTQQERLLLILHYYEDLNLTEIALVMELPERQVAQMHQSLADRITLFMAQSSIHRVAAPRRSPDSATQTGRPAGPATSSLMANASALTALA